MFDTLKAYKKLVNKGFTEEQAEVIVQAFMEAKMYPELFDSRRWGKLFRLANIESRLSNRILLTFARVFIKKEHLSRDEIIESLAA